MDVLDDVAHMRTLAEQGRNAPLLSGGHLLGWGALLCVTWAAHYFVLTSTNNGDKLGFGLGALWAGFGLVGAFMGAIMRRRLRGRPGLGSVANRGDRAVWAGVLLALLAVVFGALLRMVLFRDFAAPNTILPAAFALYGAAMISTSMLSGEKALLAFGALSIGIAAIAGVIANLPEMYLLGSAAALIVLAWPGILLLRREPAAAT